MAKTTHRQGADVLSLATALFLDLPLAETQRRLGLADEKDVQEARWKSYDAGVRILTSAIDTLYQSPAFGGTLDLSLQTLLRWQQLHNGLIGTVFAIVPELAGLPSAAQLEAVQAEIQAALNHAQPSHFQAVQTPVARDHVTVGEQKVLQSALRKLRLTRPHVTPRQGREPVLTQSAVFPTPRAVPTGNLSEYFEPIETATTDKDEVRHAASLWLDYFEPVGDGISRSSSSESTTDPAPAPPAAVTPNAGHELSQIVSPRIHP